MLHFYQNRNQLLTSPIFLRQTEKDKLYVILIMDIVKISDTKIS